MAVWGSADGEEHGWFEAGRQLLLKRPWRGPPSTARLEQRPLSVAWHPIERTIAMAVDNNLFLHGEQLA